MKEILEDPLLRSCLEALEEAIDPAVEDALLQEWKDFSDGRFTDPLFAPVRTKKAPAVPVPAVAINDAQGDDRESYRNMALSQFGDALRQLQGGTGNLLAVRCNYGVGILPSLFGCAIHTMKRELNTLPTSKPLESEEALRRAVEKGMPSLESGLGRRVFAMGQLYREIQQKYPKIGRYVWLYHPDIQGPMDGAELLWGSEMFLGLLDEPELGHSLLRLVTDTYLAFYEKWNALMPYGGTYACHWGYLHRGAIMIRNDSAMNLSPALCREFVEPYDQELFHKLGGGAMHFCGRGDHYINSYCQLEGLYGINMSQPQYNNMETIYTSTVDRGLKILKLDKAAAEQALEEGRDLHSCVSC